MGIKKFRPMTPGQRTRSILDNEIITRKGPEKSLTESLSGSGGRNHHGRITVRRRGCGHKRRYRIVDFKRNKFDVPGKVAHIEYDPNRTANIALIHYADGEKRYIIHPKGLNVGDTITSGPNANVRIGFAFHTNPQDLTAPRYPAAPGTFTYNLTDPDVQEDIREIGAAFVQWDILFHRDVLTSHLLDEAIRYGVASVLNSKSAIDAASLTSFDG